MPPPLQAGPAVAAAASTQFWLKLPPFPESHSLPPLPSNQKVPFKSKGGTRTVQQVQRAPFNRFKSVGGEVAHAVRQCVGFLGHGPEVHRVVFPPGSLQNRVAARLDGGGAGAPRRCSAGQGRPQGGPQVRAARGGGSEKSHLGQSFGPQRRQTDTCLLELIYTPGSR